MKQPYEPPEIREIMYHEDMPLLFKAWEKGLDSFIEPPYPKPSFHPQARKDRIWRKRK